MLLLRGSNVTSQPASSFGVRAVLILALCGCGSNMTAAGPDGGTGAGGGGTGGTSGGTVDASHYCNTYCERLNACDNSKDQQTCTNGCVNKLAAFVPKLRDDTITSIETCVNEKDCVTILGGNESVLKTCTEEAAAKIAPSDVASEFCA